MASKASAVHLNGSGEKMFVISRHCIQQHISQDCQTSMRAKHQGATLLK